MRFRKNLTLERLHNDFCKAVVKQPGAFIPMGARLSCIPLNAPSMEIVAYSGEKTFSVVIRDISKCPPGIVSHVAAARP